MGPAEVFQLDGTFFAVVPGLDVDSERCRGLVVDAFLDRLQPNEQRNLSSGFLGSGEKRCCHCVYVMFGYLGATLWLFLS